MPGGEELEEKILEIKGRYHYRIYQTFLRKDSLHEDIGTWSSGNWGHTGKKGQIGGSDPGGGEKYRGKKQKDGTYTSAAKQRKEKEKSAKDVHGDKRNEVLAISKKREKLEKEIRSKEALRKKLYSTQDLLKLKDEMKVLNEQSYAIRDEVRAMCDKIGISRLEQQVYTDRTVQYLPPAKVKGKQSEEEIINKVAGGDKTPGSCSSAAFAYLANVNGLDVRDFRGGNSRSFFSDMQNIMDFAKLPGVDGKTASDRNDVKATNRLLKEVKPNRLYYLATGQHAAVVRMTEDGKYEYLELQSGVAGKNKFVPLDDRELIRRFKADTDNRVFGRSVERTSVLIDGESMKNCKEFTTLLGYLNTPGGKEKKGAGGRAR